MSDPQLPPEQWRPLFEKINVEFGYRPLGTYLDMDHTRLRRLLLGGGTSETAIRRVAEGFEVTPDVIRELRGDFASGIMPFTLPDDAGRLTESERDVVRSMVRALLNARDGKNEPTTAPGTSEAPRAQGEADQDKKITQLRPTPQPHTQAKAARTRNKRFKPEDPDAT